MQDGIKQIQNAIKNKLSLYFTEIKEYSNFQSQTQYTSGQVNNRSAQEAFDAYRSSLKHMQDHLKPQSVRGADSAQLSLAQRYDLLKKQSSSGMRERNRQLKKQYEDSIKELGQANQSKTPGAAADGVIEKSIDTVRKTFEEKLKSLKEDFHRNLNEIATAKTTASNSGCDGARQAAQENGAKVSVHRIYLSGQKDDGVEAAPSPLRSCRAQHNEASFPNSERQASSQLKEALLMQKKQRSFLKEDGRGCATATDLLSSARGGSHKPPAQDRRATTKFRIEDNEAEALRLRGNGADSSPLRTHLVVLQDSLAQAACEAMQQKYKLRLDKGFKTWAKFIKLAKLRSENSSRCQ